MSTLKDEIKKWCFSKLSSNDWEGMIVKELHKNGASSKAKPPYFYSKEDVKNRSSGSGTMNLLRQNKPKTIWSGFAIEMNDLEESYLRIINSNNNGSEMIHLIVPPSTDQCIYIIEFLHKIKDFRMVVNIDLRGIDDHVMFTRLIERFTKTVSGKKTTGSFILSKSALAQDLNCFGLALNNSLNNFQTFNIECSNMQVGEILSIGVEYIERMYKITGKRDFSKIGFSLQIGNDYFEEISKLRALKLLWNGIIKTYGEDPGNSQTVWNGIVMNKPKDQNDYHNLLKATTRCMSAMIAGYDRIIMADYPKKIDTPLHRSFEKIPLILISESAFDLINDPAAGSYYVETQTIDIARKGWELFKKIENKGGYSTMLN